MSKPRSHLEGLSARANRRLRGFTLVEVIATVVVLSIIGSMASRTLMAAMNGYLTAATRAQLHSELSVALDRIEREIRRIPAKVDYGSIAPDITSITASSMAWGSYSVALAGSQVNLVDNGSASAILLSDITAFSVQAYDEGGTAMAATLSGTGCDGVRRLTVQITIQRANVTETLRTSVYLRCTMEGAPT